MKQIFFPILILVLCTLSCDAPEVCFVPDLTLPTEDTPPSSIRPRFTWNADYDTNVVYLVETSASSDFSTIYESVSFSGSIFHASKVYPHDELFYWRLQTLDCDAPPKESSFRTQSFVSFLSGDYTHIFYPTLKLKLNQDSDKRMSFSGNCGDLFFDMDDIEYWNDDEIRFHRKDSFPYDGGYRFNHLQAIYEVETEILSLNHLRQDKKSGLVTSSCSYSFSGTK